MNRDRRHDHEQHGVARHLQAELDEFLERDRDEARDRAESKPVDGGPAAVSFESLACLPDEQRDQQ